MPNQTAKKVNIPLKKIAKIVIAVLLSALLLLNLATILVSSLGLRRTLNFFPCAFVTIDSGSMEPTLSKGDLIFVWKTDYDDLKVGDIITLYSGNEFVTHQIMLINDESIVTHGLANNRADDPIDETQYCAKMVIKFQGGAAVWNVLTSTLTTILLAVLVLVIFFGIPLLSYLFDRIKAKKSKEENAEKAPLKKSFKVGVLRLLSSLCLISILFVTPFFSSAKYVADINGIAQASASAVYFTSNFLSEKGNNYNIKGWEGLAYDIHLQMKDYDNLLLYNTEGKDISYYLYIDKNTDTAFSQDYEFVVTYEEQDLVPNENGSYGPFTMQGKDDVTVTHSINVAVRSTVIPYGTLEPIALTGGSKISFTVKAETSKSEMYYHVLKGTFALEVAESNEFLGERTLTQTANSSLMSYTMKTNQISGIASRKIVIEWDNREMYINRIDNTVLRLLTDDPNALKTADDGHTTTLTIMAEPYSSISMTFYKLSNLVSYDFISTHQTIEEGENGATETYEYIVIDANGYIPPADDPVTSDGEKESKSHSYVTEPETEADKDNES